MLNSTGLMDDDKVSSLMIEPGRWNMETLAEYFHPNLLNTIISLPILHMEDKDLCVWAESGASKVKASQVYKLLLSQDDQGLENTKKFKAIWCIVAAPRVKLFWWKVIWGGLAMQSYSLP